MQAAEAQALILLTGQEQSDSEATVAETAGLTEGARSEQQIAVAGVAAAAGVDQIRPEEPAVPA
jgi:hypothetical protein